MKKFEVIERGIGYKIYKKDGIYFVETAGNKKFAVGHDTLQGAIEHAYYQGYRTTK